MDPADQLARDRIISAWYMETGALRRPELSALVKDRPCELMVHVVIRKPRSAPKSRVYPSVRPDLSNHIKQVEDALNGLAFTDDSQIVKITALKTYAHPKMDEGCVIEIIWL